MLMTGSFCRSLRSTCRMCVFASSAAGWGCLQHRALTSPGLALWVATQLSVLCHVLLHTSPIKHLIFPWGLTGQHALSDASMGNTLVNSSGHNRFQSLMSHLLVTLTLLFQISAQRSGTGYRRFTRPAVVISGQNQLCKWSFFYCALVKMSRCWFRRYTCLCTYEWKD